MVCRSTLAELRHISTLCQKYNITPSRPSGMKEFAFPVITLRGTLWPTLSAFPEVRTVSMLLAKFALLVIYAGCDVVIHIGGRKEHLNNVASLSD